MLEIMQGISGLINKRSSHASGVILFDEDPYEFGCFMKTPKGVVISKNGEYYLDDVNRARATSVSYENGTYSYTTSGVDGYYHGVRVYNDWFTMKSQYYETGTLNGVQMNNMTYQPGNQPRTEKNRVRCVRKMN